MFKFIHSSVTAHFFLCAIFFCYTAQPRPAVIYFSVFSPPPEDREDPGKGMNNILPKNVKRKIFCGMITMPEKKRKIKKKIKNPGSTPLLLNGLTPNADWRAPVGAARSGSLVEGVAMTSSARMRKNFSFFLVCPVCVLAEGSNLGFKPLGFAGAKSTNRMTVTGEIELSPKAQSLQYIYIYICICAPFWHHIIFKKCPNLPTFYRFY